MGRVWGKPTRIGGLMLPSRSAWANSSTPPCLPLFHRDSNSLGLRDAQPRVKVLTAMVMVVTVMS